MKIENISDLTKLIASLGYSISSVKDIDVNGDQLTFTISDATNRQPLSVLNKCDTNGRIFNFEVFSLILTTNTELSIPTAFLS